MSGVLAQRDCTQFVQTVLNAVSSNSNPVYPANGSLTDVFESFLAQGNNHSLLTRQNPPGGWGYGSPVGNIKNGDAVIYSPNVGSTAAIQLMADADTIIAELFHFAGRRNYYTDEQLAKAVHNSKYGSEADSVISPEANIFDKRYQARGWTRLKGVFCKCCVRQNHQAAIL